jgi:two-component system, OmpR family, sensor kinase
VASPAFSTRSAARATSSAVRALPIRWRLAGGSALLTFVILCAFAVVVGTLTTQRIRRDFDDSISRAADDLASKVTLTADKNGTLRCNPPLDAYATAENAVIRLVRDNGQTLCQTSGAPPLAPPLRKSIEVGGYRVESRAVDLLVRLPFNYANDSTAVLQYARPLADVRRTIAKVRLFLAFGVLGGTIAALLAGLAIARRAMAPITELTEAAREIARTRDPGVELPRSEADDEVAELGRTLEEMLRSLETAQSETEATLQRQREFVADASHELRTPLTSVLANLELLADDLDGEHREIADSALRSTRRMRRLVADLLLLARADAGRVARREPIDLASVVVDAVAELEPVARDGQFAVTARPTPVEGARDELHRMALNLIENALRHTPPDTAVEIRVHPDDGRAILDVEDDGPGVPEELRPRIFERFVRSAADRGGGTGLGLSIVRSVAQRHGGEVTMEPPLDGVGARFVVRLPLAGDRGEAEQPSAAPDTLGA